MDLKHWSCPNVCRWMLLSVGLAVRLWQLDKPAAVVFDELHYVRFVSLYLNRTFHFDANPPLGKLLVALSAWLNNADVSHAFARIGDVYPPSFNIWWLRFVPAVFGSLLVLTGFQIMQALGFGLLTSSLAAILIIFENSLLTQSRFVLMETPVMFFISMAILSYVEFRKVDRVQPLGLRSLCWSACLSLSLAFAIGVKYIAVCTFFLLVIHSVVDFWKILPNRSVSDRTILKHVISRFLFLAVVPAFIYLLLFHVHLRLLVNSGPHDDLLTSSFQASLRGGLSSITKKQPMFVAYGSQVTLRQTYGKPCWLHSHDHLYPLEYEDGRGSSHQQQVSCYSFKDVNNWWIIKDPNSNELTVDDPVRVVRDGDMIQLIHGMTSRALNSHDVAAPMSPQFPEVSCYVDHNVSSLAQTTWTVKIVNAQEPKEAWRMISSTVRLIHFDTDQALKTSGRQLDEWGFYQWEIVTDKLHQQPSAIWNVEEHRYTSDEEEEEAQQSENLQSVGREDVDKEMGFFAKFWELQVKMLTMPLGISHDHRYSSDPTYWPLMAHNIIYWVNSTSQTQIHLVGNFAIWFPATGALVVFLLLFGFYMLRRRRKCYDLPEDSWNQFIDVGSLIFAGYLIHYLPYLLADHTLFLYQYLPALFFKILLLVAVIDHVYFILQKLSRNFSCLFVSMVVLWVLFVVSTFLRYASLTFGLVPISSALADNLRVFESWDFIIRRD